MLFSDASTSRPTGRLHLEVSRCGQLIDVFDECNLVVDGYKDTHAHLIGSDTANYRVTQFGVGTGGISPVVGNTALSSPFLKGIDSISFPSLGQVQFGFSLSSGEANGMAILEFGLLTTAGVLYARRIRPTALVKTSDISFAGSWVITF